jgi:hypothetical protein
MARGPCAFRQQDVKRAVKAVVAAGMTLRRIEIDKNGKIVLDVSDVQAEGASGILSQDNEWDTVG